jgi:DNA-directed RNA polymerase specialized sigma24 family protein
VPALVRYVDSVLRALPPPPGAPLEAEEVVQDFLVVAMEDGRLANQGRRVESFRRFLATCLRRHVLDRLDAARARKRSPRATAPTEALDGALSREDDPAEAALHEGIVGVGVERALARLRRRSETHAEVVADLLRTQGVGSDEARERLDVPPANRRDVRHRARRQFGTFLLEELRDLSLDARDFDDLLARVDPYLP